MVRLPHYLLVGTLLLACSGCGTVSTTSTLGGGGSRGHDSSDPLATLPAATRLLDQATFGPTSADSRHVQQIGLPAYLDEQFSAAPTYLPIRPISPKPAGARTQLAIDFFSNALAAPDQLRQRVAFALSEIFVVSNLSAPPESIAPYHNMLLDDAFGNFQTLLHDVTVSPAMGNYLNMLNSAAPAAGQIANENYAREFMQLFTTGPNQLNHDGTTAQGPDGNPIANYSGDQVQSFARAYTGWTFANSDGAAPATFPNPTANYALPMVPVEAAHDTNSKTLLSGTTLPGGLSARQDLDLAIANVFNQPGVSPFICRQLIQHLIMSNPSQAFVNRIAGVFDDNGNGVRGDLKAVIRAILLDHKARVGDTQQEFIDGHLREPILWMVNVFRGLNFVFNGPGQYQELILCAQKLFEIPYQSTSVFNFYPPSYVEPTSGVNAPEFAIENTGSSLLRVSVADQIVQNQVGGLYVDLTATGPLGTLAADPGALVDALNNMLLHGQMQDNMRQAIVDHVATLSDPAQRARVAVFLVITSPEYKVMH